MDLQSSITQYLSDYESRWPLNGVVLAAKDGKLVLREAYGTANLEHGIPCRTDTRFRIWSISKSFTAMAVMLLREEGKLKLDEPVGRYFPGIRGMDRITAEQLMHHRSGLANFTALPSYNGLLNKTKMSKQEVLRLVADHPAEFAAGSAFSYNNSGYVALAHLVERIAELSFEQFVTERILRPLGMNDSGLDTGTRTIAGMASPYSSSGDDIIPAEYIHMSSVEGAGSMYSTTDDLYKWDQSFYDGRLLPQSVMAELLEARGANYGMGWFLDDRQGRRRISHGGAYIGFRSEMIRYPEERAVVIMLTNLDYVPVTRIASDVAALLLGGAAEAPVKPDAYPLPDETFDELAGRYEGFGCSADVKRDGSRHYFIWNDSSVVPIYPVSPTKFRHLRHDWGYEFKRNDRGEISFLGMAKTNPQTTTES